MSRTTFPRMHLGPAMPAPLTYKVVTEWASRRVFLLAMPHARQARDPSSGVLPTLNRLWFSLRGWDWMRLRVPSITCCLTEKGKGHCSQGRDGHVGVPPAGLEGCHLLYRHSDG